VIVLPSSVRDTIVDRAREGSPEEICGVFGGEYDADGPSQVRSQYPAENVADRPRTRYRIDPEEQFAIFERLDARGEEIVGFYHSHPDGPPRPSKTDTELATWPDRSYVILSLAPFAIGSWRWRQDATDGDDTVAPVGQFDRERLDVE